MIAFTFLVGVGYQTLVAIYIWQLRRSNRVLRRSFCPIFWIYPVLLIICFIRVRNVLHALEILLGWHDIPSPLIDLGAFVNWLSVHDWKVIGCSILYLDFSFVIHNDLRVESIKAVFLVSFIYGVLFLFHLKRTVTFSLQTAVVLFEVGYILLTRWFAQVRVVFLIAHDLVLDVHIQLRRRSANGVFVVVLNQHLVSSWTVRDSLGIRHVVKGSLYLVFCIERVFCVDVNLNVRIMHYRVIFRLCNRQGLLHSRHNLLWRFPTTLNSLFSGVLRVKVRRLSVSAFLSTLNFLDATNRLVITLHRLLLVEQTWRDGQYGWRFNLIFLHRRY